MEPVVYQLYTKVKDFWFLVLTSIFLHYQQNIMSRGNKKKYLLIMNDPLSTEYKLTAHRTLKKVL